MNNYREVWDRQNYKFTNVDATPWLPLEEFEPVGFWTRVWMWVTK
jgi:hypothetical protein